MNFVDKNNYYLYIMSINFASKSSRAAKIIHAEQQAQKEKKQVEEFVDRLVCEDRLAVLCAQGRHGFDV